MISDWVATEVSSALSLKVSTRALDISQRAVAQASFDRMVSQGLDVVAVTRAHFMQAARFAERHDLALRGGDALHLAICADHGASLATLDRRLRDAAPTLGVAVETI